MSRHALRRAQQMQQHPSRFASHNTHFQQRQQMLAPPGADTGTRPTRMFGHPSVPGVYSYEEAKARFSVYNYDLHEVLTTSLYDSAPYAAAGVNQLTFFQNGIGQGVGFGGGTKTLSDTNINTNGLLPNGVTFLVQEIEIEIQPTTPTVAAQMPAVFGLQAAALLVNDAYIIGRAGSVTLQILQKNYLTEAPVGQFVPRYDFDVSGAFSDTTTAAAASQSRMAFGKWIGRSYVLSPVDLRLAEMMNFAVIIKYEEGLQVVSNPARLFVRLRGLEYRLSQ